LAPKQLSLRPINDFEIHVNESIKFIIENKNEVNLKCRFGGNQITSLSHYDSDVYACRHPFQDTNRSFEVIIMDDGSAVVATFFFRVTPTPVLNTFEPMLKISSDRVIVTFQGSFLARWKSFRCQITNETTVSAIWLSDIEVCKLKQMLSVHAHC
jgi:hypothetical protein